MTMEQVNASETVGTLPIRYKTGLEDQIFYWMGGEFDSQNYCIIELDGRLEEDRLNRAMRLMVDAEPVLGCRYVPGIWHQCWERLARLDAVEFCRVVPCDENDSSLTAFLRDSPLLVTDQGPQVKSYILRSPQRDRLCIKITHAMADGGGLRDLAYQLAFVYRKLKAVPSYHPAPNIHGRRSLRQVTRHFNISQKMGILKRSALDLTAINWPPVFTKQPPVVHRRDDREYVLRRFPPEKIRGIRRLAAGIHASLNDVVTAAYLRTFYNLINPDPEAFLRLVCTADLRRHIPGGRAESVCGLSGFVYLNIGRDLDPELEQVTIRIRDRMNLLKRDYLGLGGSFPVTLAAFKLLPFPWALRLHDRMSGHMKRQVMGAGRVLPLFTNGGRLNPADMEFGDARPVNAFFSAPLSYPPTFAAALTVCGDCMNFCTGFCEATLPKNRVDDFFDFMENELPDE